MGLKQTIEKAMQGDDEAVAALPPVEISGVALRTYGQLIRQWSGWKDATVVFDEPTGSPFASCHRGTHVITANPERLLLNPNRVLRVVNPFRLRQEAVLTGALLHEAAHARHSNWIPRSEVEAELFTHADGSPVTKAEFALAKLLEEPRIEGLMAKEASQVGADGLEWTLRASAAHLVPPTAMSADPNQAVMDVIGSWALRAGRQISLEFHTRYIAPLWVGQFTSLLRDVVFNHLVEASTADATDAINSATVQTRDVIELLTEMCRGTAASLYESFIDAAGESDSGPFMVDQAKRVLSILFPETPSDQMPMASSGCGEGEAEKGDTNVAADLESELGEGEGSGEADEADEAGTGEPAEGEGEGEPTDGPAEPGEGEGEGEGEGAGAGADTESETAKALAAVESEAKAEATEDGESQPQSQPKAQSGGLQGGSGAPSVSLGGGWRTPTGGERDLKAGAEKFLRNLIEPGTSSKVRITDQPSSMIDGAALAAWKAGGQVKAPRFFQQVKRTVKPSPPVKIAVLVDVSASMDAMQKPSAVLSWALAASCLDLRNFAGAGVQVESTLIHWGDRADVIQKNGEVLRGIREVPCDQNTTAMHRAIDLIGEQIPGFFDIGETPENKLLIQFTDWRLSPTTRSAAAQRVGRCLEAGVNMLSVVPRTYTGRFSSLPDILSASKVQRGRNSLVLYGDSDKPEKVWAEATKALGY